MGGAERYPRIKEVRLGEPRRTTILRVLLTAAALLLCSRPLVSSAGDSREKKAEPASAPAKAEAPAVDDKEFLTARDLLLPVKGVDPSALVDTYTAPRSKGRTHHAIDIMADKGTPIFATADGTIHKLHNNVNGGISIYQRDDTGPYIYYYAHLSRYADGLKEGQAVKRGDVIGYVGNTGNARRRLPHLHFSIFRVVEEKVWWRGVSVNPYPLLSKPKPES
jgi:peptidoglycan LD-endopeptidase LytH